MPTNRPGDPRDPNEPYNEPYNESADLGRRPDASPDDYDYASSSGPSIGSSLPHGEPGVHESGTFSESFRGHVNDPSFSGRPSSPGDESFRTGGAGSEPLYDSEPGGFDPSEIGAWTVRASERFRSFYQQNRRSVLGVAIGAGLVVGLLVMNSMRRSRMDRD